MHPIICHIGPFTVFSYGLMLVIGFLLAVNLAQRQARRQGLNPDFIFNLAFIVFICGIIGARIFFIFSHLAYYIGNPREILLLQHGGLSWFGGLFAGTAGVIFYTRRKKQSVYEVMDILVPFLALAQAVGRIGCYLNGCCYGNASAWGIYSPEAGTTLIPTQLYSSLFLVVIYMVLRSLQDRPHRAGEIFYSYLMLYSLKRFFLEFWRGDTIQVIAGFSLFQLISLAVFCTAAILLSRSTGRNRA